MSLTSHIGATPFPAGEQLTRQAIADLTKSISAMLQTQQQIVGALQLAVGTPATVVSQEKPKKRREHERGGAKWTAEEDEFVIASFEGGSSVAEIARHQKRSWVAIMARLERLGYVPRDLRFADLESPATTQARSYDKPQG